MKKIIFGLIAVMCAISILGCAKKEVDMVALATDLLNNGMYAEELTEVNSKITEKRYAMTDDDIEDVIAYCGTNAVVDEIAVFKAKDVDSVSEKAAEHIENQKKLFSDYRPSEVPKLDSCVIVSEGDYIIVSVSADSAKAEEIINKYIK